jgi:flagellar hook-associated protein 2
VNRSANDGLIGSKAMAVALTTNPNPIGASVTSTGLGTNLNVNAIVPSLVNAEIAPIMTLLQAKQTADKSTISALGTVKSTLSALQAALEAITTGTALTGLAASSSNASVFTATASSSAVAGTYNIEVNTLAKTNTIMSSAYANANTVVGDGTITVNAGGSSFNVTLSPGNDTLANLRDAINNASNNTGVSAAIITAVDGAHLSLSSTQTGTANAVSVTSPLLTFTTASAASDAKIFVNGLQCNSSSNVISGAISGITLNLVSAQPGTQNTLTVAANTQGAVGAVQAFVNNYNTALTTLQQATAYNASTKQAGPLLGDISTQSLLGQMQSITGGSLSMAAFNVSTLSQIGITTNKDGTLSVNTSTLTAALQSNAQGVQALLSKANTSLGTKLDTALTGYVKNGGLIDARTTVLQTDVANLQSQITSYNQRSADLTQLYTKRFNSIGTIVSRYTTMSNYLTQMSAQYSKSKS